VVIFRRTASLSAPIFVSKTASHHTVLSPRPIPSLGAGIGATSCLPEWLLYQGHCYGFFADKTSWSDAEVQCQYHRKGAHLASIITGAEGDTVARYITESGSKDPVWIGLHDPRQNTLHSDSAPSPGNSRKGFWKGEGDVYVLCSY
uniref:C-type lectin domain-containing protein n=1 Tax=Chelydra serpentina TaxID=8475 RepID=A0A8C3SE80_CHESE